MTVYNIFHITGDELEKWAPQEKWFYEDYTVLILEPFTKNLEDKKQDLKSKYKNFSE